MSEFSLSIPCVTCRRTLQITDPNLLGAIATCPACGSMVEVPAGPEPPAGPDVAARSDGSSRSDSSPSPAEFAIGDATVDSAAITEESILAEGVLSGAPPPSGFTDHPGNKPKPGLGQAVDVAADPNASVKPDAALGPEWESNQSQNVRKIGLMVAAALIAMATLGVAMSAWVRRDRPTASNPPTLPDTVAEEPETISSNVAADPAKNAATVSTSPQPDESDDLSAAPSEPPIDSKDPPAGDPVPTMGSESFPETGLPPLVPNPILDTPRDIGSSDSSKKTIGSDTPSLNKNDGKNSDGGASQLTELPRGLLPFMPFVPTEAPTTKPTLETPPSMDEVRIEAAAERDDPLQPPKDRTINPNTDLAMSLAIKAKHYPAVDLLLILSSLTDVPIEVDLTAFDVAGISVRQDFSPQSTEARSVLQWVREIAHSVNGQLRFEPTYVMIEPNDESFQTGWNLVTDRSDLPDSTEPLQDFLKIEAEDDRVVGKDARRYDQMLAAFACESLRRMRRVDPKMDQARLARWAGALTEGDSSVTASGWPKLEKIAMDGQPDTPISMVRFLQMIGTQTESTMMIHWLDSTRRGNGPATMVFPDIESDPATAIGRTLAPLRIQVRRMDAHHLWVGSESSYDRLPILVWTDALGNRRKAFEQQLAAATVNLPENDFRYLYDPVSDRALVMIPRFIHRQMNKIMGVLAKK